MRCFSQNDQCVKKEKNNSSINLIMCCISNNFSYKSFYAFKIKYFFLDFWNTLTFKNNTLIIKLVLIDILVKMQNMKNYY